MYKNNYHIQSACSDDGVFRDLLNIFINRNLIWNYLLRGKQDVDYVISVVGCITDLFSY